MLSPSSATVLYILNIQIPMDYYSSIADGYDQLHGEEQERKHIIIASKLVLSSQDKLLDVGCGTGLGFRHYKCRLWGIEPAEKMAQRAMQHADVQVASAESIPFPDQSFDVVISVTAIHNFPDIEKGLLEMRRVGRQRFVFSLLKKSSRLEMIRQLILKHFELKEEIDEGMDIILFCK